MTEQSNIQQAGAIYAAIGRGDLPGLLAAVADDVEIVVPRPADVPWGGTWRGKDGVQQWFGILGQNFAYEAFEPREFIAQGDKVVALVHTAFTMRKTGRPVMNPLAHIFTFGDGKLVRLQVYEDTAAVAFAYLDR